MLKNFVHIKIFFILFLFLMFFSFEVFAMGGEGATCNPSTDSWGSCELSPVPFQDSVINTIYIPAGNYPTPYQANQANTEYILQGDITADGTAITVNDSYIIVNLNGHTITYNQAESGEGVNVGTWNKNHIAVRNGSIIQGVAMSEGDLYGCGNNPVSTYNTALGGQRSASNVHIANLYVRYGGRDVGGIIWAGNEGLFEQNTIEDTYEFGTLKNRHQGSEALTGSKNSNNIGNIYRYNTIINTRHRGITTGNNAQVYGNYIGIRSIATNANGVGQYSGENISIHDNTIVGRGEHPVGIGAGGGDDGSDNYDIYNNIIDLQITALGEEYGSAYLNDPLATYEGNSASGIRVTWGGDNIHVYNNQITIVTDDRYVGTYSPTGVIAYINGGGKGLFIGAYEGESSTYENNIISVTGDSSHTFGVTCSYSFSDGMFVIGNTITSSQYNIVMGDDYGQCNDYPLFKDNILIKDSAAQSGYSTYANTYNDTDRDSQVRLVDNTYQDGAAESSISLLPGHNGLTDIYFGSVIDGQYKYNYRLHDGNNTSPILLREDFEPPTTLVYRVPASDIVPPTSSTGLSVL
ncbi:MAG: hypothetical protein V3574_03540 [Candidatus Moraniibacteriota bacterium]